MPGGSRVSAPPGGGPPDLNKFDLPTADGLILLAAHPGQGTVLMVRSTRRGRREQSVRERPRA